MARFDWSCCLQSVQRDTEISNAHLSKTGVQLYSLLPQAIMEYTCLSLLWKREHQEKSFQEANTEGTDKRLNYTTA